MVCAWLAASTLARSSSAGFPILWAVLPLVGAVLVAAALVAVIQRWRRSPGPERLSVSDQLSEFRSLYEAGELSAEEFARIRARLGPQLKQELEIPPGPGVGATEPPSPNPSPNNDIRPGPPGTP